MRLTRRFRRGGKARALALICEGTHPGTKKPVTEGEVAANCFEVVSKAGGLVVADFGPRNVERLLSFLEIAGKTGRQLVLTTKDVYLLEALKAAEEDGVPDPHADGRIRMYIKPKSRMDKWEAALLERMSIDKTVTAEDIKRPEVTYFAFRTTTFTHFWTYSRRAERTYTLPARPSMRRCS